MFDFDQFKKQTIHLAQIHFTKLNAWGDNSTEGVAYVSFRWLAEGGKVDEIRKPEVRAFVVVNVSDHILCNMKSQ